MPPPQPPEQPSIRERILFAERIMEFPALTIMVILRQDMGYRALNPLAILAVTGVLAVICILSIPNSPDSRPSDLLIFAGVVFVFGMGQRLRRWRQLNKHVRQHSFYIGTSPFEFRWLPVMFKRNRRIPRFIDPLFCGVIGFLLYPYSHALSLWLIFAAICLRTFEYTVHRDARHKQMDLIDGIITSERQVEILEQFEQGSPVQQGAEEGIPTGLGDDVRELIKRRNKILSAVLVSLAFLLIQAAKGDSENYNELEWRTDSSQTSVEVGGYTGPKGALVIPSIIDNLPVASIHFFGFDECDTITSVTIPSSVTDIGEDAFSLCTNLTQVVIDNGITSIASHTFLDCVNLNSSTIPNSVK